MSLANIRVLVTRPLHQAEALCGLIERQQGYAIRFPTLAIEALNHSPLLAQLINLDWLIFTSANAVNFALTANNGTITSLKNLRLVAIGKATANALKNQGLTVDVIPKSGFTSEALLALPEFEHLNQQHCLIVRGQGGREILAEGLRARGARVNYLEVYRRLIPECDSSPVIAQLQRGEIDIITLHSGQSLDNLMVMMPKKSHQQLLKISLVVVSERIKKLAINYGFQRIVVSNYAADTEIMASINALINGE